MPSRTTARGPVRQRGAATIETAIAALAFFAILLPTIDLGRGLFMLVTLEHAVGETVRFAATGASMEDPNSPGTYLSRSDSIRRILEQYAGGIDLSTATVNVTSTTIDGEAGTGPGGPGDLITLEVSVDLELFTPVLRDAFEDGIYSLRATASMASEHFPSGT